MADPEGSAYRRRVVDDELDVFLEELPASLRRLLAGERDAIADPALAARLLDVGAEDLLAGRSHGPRPPRDGLLLAALFESLVALNVRVYAQTAQARVTHLQTWNDSREVDLIVEKGRWMVALEVKLVATPRREDTRHLRWLTDRMGAGVADAVLVTTGRHAYRDRDGIAVVPAALLGP